jgi:hypothetical protein
MDRSADVSARIEAKVPALAGRFEAAARLAQLIAREQAPERTPAAFALFGEIQGGAADMITGFFSQHVRETVAVLLFERAADDRHGGKAGAKLSSLVTDVIEAVCGWGPDDGIGGVFTLRSAGFVGFVGSALLYQIDFALDDQMRITT